MILMVNFLEHGFFNKLLIVSIIIIAILGISLVYEIVQKNQDAKYYKQFAIALDVQLYQGLERGDVEAVKQRLGRFVAANSLLYEQQYGHETDTKFAMRERLKNHE